MKYNLKTLILARLKELDKDRFNSFAGDIEKEIEVIVEKTVREEVGAALKRVLRLALRETKQTQKDNSIHEN
jgi:hypothetical protein